MILTFAKIIDLGVIESIIPYFKTNYNTFQHAKQNGHAGRVFLTLSFNSPP